MQPYKLYIVYHGVRTSFRDNIEEDIMEFWNERIKPKSGIDLKITIVDTGGLEQVRLKYFKNYSDGREAWGTANGKSICRKFVEQSSAHQVIFMYDAKKADLYSQMTGNKFLTSWSYWEELYPNTEFTEVKIENSPNSKSVSHETMHALAKKCQRSGRSEVIDHMDVTVVDGKLVEYYLNSTPNAPDGNYSRTINSITNANAWKTISLDTRNMYESRKISGEQTIVLKKDGKWFEIATAPELWLYVQAKYQIPNNLPEISRNEVMANYGGQAKVDIYFDS